MSGAHFDLDGSFENFDDFNKATSEQMKNYTSNSPLSTTASVSTTARSMALGTQAEILQGVGFYEPKEYISQIMEEELSSIQQTLLQGDTPFKKNSLTRPSMLSSRSVENSRAVNSAVAMAFSSVHPSDLDDYELLDPPGLEGYTNGYLPLEVLRFVDGHPGLRLWHEAAAAWTQMRAALLQDGYVNDENNKMINSAYRSYQDQWRIKYDPDNNGVRDVVDGVAYDNPDAADPGSSKHGWGLAIDFNKGFYQDQKGAINMYGFDWLLANAHLYGFVWPHWAQKAGNNYRGYYEPWHWEYRGHLYV